MSLTDIKFELKGDDSNRFVCLTCGKTYSMLGPHLDNHFKNHEYIKNKITHMKGQKYSYSYIAKRLSMPMEEVKRIRQEARGKGGREVEGTKNLSLKIIQRFMTEDELKEFMKKYQGNKSMAGGFNRKAYLEQPLSEDEVDLLRFYITDTDRSLKEYAEEKGLVRQDVYGKVMRSAIKLVYQHPELLEGL